MRRGMPKIEGGVFGTPTLFLARRWPQQRAIAAAHQRQAILDQADGLTAQVMRLPGALGNALRAEENLGDFAISRAGQAAVERTERHRQTASAVRGECVQGQPRRTAVEGPPEPPRRVRAKLEVAVEREFGRIGYGDDRRFL